MAGAQAQQPTTGRTPAGDLDDRSVEGAGVELVPAEHPWLQDAVEAGVGEQLLRLLGEATADLCLLLLVDQMLTKRHRAGHHLIGRETWVRYIEAHRVTLERVDRGHRCGP